MIISRLQCISQGQWVKRQREMHIVAGPRPAGSGLCICGINGRKHTSWWETPQVPANSPTNLDCYTVSLHSPNGRQMPAVRAVRRDCERFYRQRLCHMPAIILEQALAARLFTKNLKLTRTQTAHLFSYQDNRKYFNIMGQGCIDHIVVPLNVTSLLSPREIPEF